MSHKEADDMNINDLPNKPFLVPTDVAAFIGCNPYSINLQAQYKPEKLGFPVIVLGRRVKIPRDGFIRWYKGMLSVPVSSNT